MGAGRYGGMGNTAGSSADDSNSFKSTSRSIDDNVKMMKKEYPITKGGYFGRKGKNVRVIDTDTPEKTSTDFFSKIGDGGHIDKLSNGKGYRIIFEDGTIVTHRISTKTEGSPAVDINIVNSKLIKTQKIHFVKEDEQ